MAHPMAAMNATSVRYPVAGGIRVVAHGYLRYTKNVHLVILCTPLCADRPVSFVSIPTSIAMKESRVASRTARTSSTCA